MAPIFEPPLLLARPGGADVLTTEIRAFAALVANLALDNDDAFECIVDCARTLFSSDFVGINRVEHSGKLMTLHWHAVSDALAQPHDGWTAYSRPFADAMWRNELHYIVAGDPLMAPLVALDPAIREALICPWLANGVPVGTICLMTRNPDTHFHEDDARLLRTLAGYVSIAWQSSTARRDAVRTREHLAQWIESHARDIAVTDDAVDLARDGEARLAKLFKQAPSFIAILRGPHHVFEFYNDAYVRLVGPRLLHDRPVRDVFPDLEGQVFLYWLDCVYRSGGVHVRHEMPLHLKSAGDGTSQQRYVDFVYQPITNGRGRTTGVFIEGHDVTVRVKANEALRESEASLRTLTEGIPQLLWRADVNGAWTWCSSQWVECTGLSVQDSLGMGWLSAIHPDDRRAVISAWKEDVQGAIVLVEYRVRRASDGAWLWHHSRALPVHNATGEIIEWLGTSTDIHPMKVLQERQSVLVTELRHRTRNLIGVARAIAQQSLLTAESLEEFATAFGERLDALAKVQSLLALPDDEAITLEALLRLELDSVGAFVTPDRVFLSGPSIAIRRSTVQMLALALHELATNARKHGALSTAGGRLDLTWHVEESEEGPMLALDWIESGLTDVDVHPSPTGFGRYLLEKALPHLGAKTHFELDLQGARYRIALPLDADETARKASRADPHTI